MKRIFLFFFVFFVSFQITCYSAKFSFAVFGDHQDGDATFMKIINLVNNDTDITFVVNTGDLTSHGTNSEYDNYWRMCKTCRVKIYDVIGNHDLGSLNAGQNIFKKKYGETYYYFDRGDVRFIILDNSRSTGMGKKQFDWLKGVLDTKKIKLVFIHKPLFDPTGTYPAHIMLPQAENKKLEKLLLDNKVSYVFAGHIHGYAREERDGVMYVVTAGAGAPLYLPSFGGGYYHYVKVTVDGSKITDEVVKLYE
jgi:predicted phosphodiesterase